MSGIYQCQTIERPWINNERSISCIPVGEYKLNYREELTPLTIEYRNRFDWFNFHIEVKGVPNRSGIYFHVANKPEDVKGCIGTGADPIGPEWVSNSRKTFEHFYKQFKPGTLIIENSF